MNAPRARPHYHAYLESRAGVIWRRTRGSWWSHQGARQSTDRNYPGRGRIVLKCTRPECAPPEPRT